MGGHTGNKQVVKTSKIHWRLFLPIMATVQKETLSGKRQWQMRMPKN